MRLLEVVWSDGFEVREDVGEEAMISGQQTVCVELRVRGDEEIGKDAGPRAASKLVFPHELACEKRCLGVKRSDGDAECAEEL